MARLSEEQLDNAIAWSARAKGEFVASGIQPLRMTEFDELIRGYRRAAELEGMLREWVDGAVEEWGQALIESMRSAFCLECDSKEARSRTDLLHADGCLVQRTEALLAEGDE